MMDILFLNLEMKIILSRSLINNRLRFKLSPISDGQNKNFIICRNEEEEEVSIPALTFMRFIVINLPTQLDPIDDKIVLPLLTASFGHELSEIGIRTLIRVERELLQRFNRNWIEP
jgi:hypothetical protein